MVSPFRHSLLVALSCFALCFAACAGTYDTGKLTPQPSDNNSSTPLSGNGQNHSNRIVASETDDNVTYSDRQKNNEIMHACFENTIAHWDNAFVASSLMPVLLNSGNSVMAVNSSAGEALIVFLNDSGQPESIKISENAQISCIESISNGFRVGMITRDVSQGTFTDVVAGFDEHFQPLDDEAWRVGVRGFMPDPGTRCSFLERREMLVIGTRPRGEHVPYHGMFRAQSRSLDFFEATQEHTPSLIMTRQNGNHQEILVRDVRRNEDNKPIWPYVVWTVGEDNSLNEIVSSDYIVPEGDSWLKITKNGCIERMDGQKICPDQTFDITDVQPLPDLCSDDTCMLWTSWKQSWVVRIHDNEIKSARIPDGMRILPISEGRLWVVYQIDSEHPDEASELKFMKPNLDCIGL